MMLKWTEEICTINEPAQLFFFIKILRELFFQTWLEYRRMKVVSESLKHYCCGFVSDTCMSTCCFQCLFLCQMSAYNTGRMMVNALFINTLCLVFNSFQEKELMSCIAQSVFKLLVILRFCPQYLFVVQYFSKNMGRLKCK